MSQICNATYRGPGSGKSSSITQPIRGWARLMSNHTAENLRSCGPNYHVVGYHRRKESNSMSTSTSAYWNICCGGHEFVSTVSILRQTPKPETATCAQDPKSQDPEATAPIRLLQTIHRQSAGCYQTCSGRQLIKVSKYIQACGEVHNQGVLNLLQTTARNQMKSILT